MKTRLWSLGLFLLLASFGAMQADQKDWAARQEALRTGVCHVHRFKMAKRQLPISYGFPITTDYDRQLQAAAKVAFPHAADYVLGGCVISPGAPRTAEALECPICRVNKTAWEKKHPRPPRK